MFDEYKKLQIHVPPVAMIQEGRTQELLSTSNKFDNPLMYLLAARWAEAATCMRFPFAETIHHIDNPTERSVIVTSDYAMAHNEWCRVDPLDLANSGHMLLVFSCANDAALTEPRGVLNAFDWIPNKRVRGDGFYAMDARAAYQDKNVIVTPMGCGSSWLPKPGNNRPKRVLLDEVHMSVIEQYGDQGIFDVSAFLHALEVCRELWEMGYEISTFNRSSGAFRNMLRIHHPHIEVIDCQGWLPFDKMMETYANSPLFFSHFQEAHGYPIYENLQLGNGIIAYSENVNPSVVRNFETGVLLHTTMQPKLAAQLIDSYFTRYETGHLQDVISNESYLRYSCDTFVIRLVQALEAKGVVFRPE